ERPQARSRARRPPLLRRHRARGQHQPQGHARSSVAAISHRVAARLDAPGRARGMSRRRALVSAARGIGDILRITPLVRGCARLGYDVDVLIASDYAEVAGLIDGDADIRRLFHVPSPWRGGPAPGLGELAAERYDVATFTFWSQALRPHVRAARMFAFAQSEWLRDG